ncbi:MCE family protein [Nocardioides acrostichi]|uniref:MCE family protein n=1 Tax=Nocardioides acrostichi TaxID=2784339 RepID=A0A930UWI1_9ACTN|nr:MCE family protein [Nocardioides acrostichi]MBF4162148.1 MCE family protein [Nocardioides acrostichi]
MRDYSQARILRAGTILLVLMGVILAATFNLSKFPGMGGTTYQAYFADASGLHRGSQVLIGGIRSGRVSSVDLDDGKVLVDFSVDDGVEFGPDSSASIEVFNLLGEKYLKITPEGSGELDPKTPIPLDRTESAYDIVGVTSDLVDTTQAIDKSQLKQALDTLGDITDQAAPEIQGSLTGISRLSRTVASRDTELRQLLSRSQHVTKTLANRRGDIVKLMRSASQVFAELQTRKQSVHALLVNARTLSDELRGLAQDNQQQIGPALAQVDQLLNTLNSRNKELRELLKRFGPYASLLSNIIGTGPWFDAYLGNVLGFFTGEFVPQQSPSTGGDG